MLLIQHFNINTACYFCCSFRRYLPTPVVIAVTADDRAGSFVRLTADLEHARATIYTI